MSPRLRTALKLLLGLGLLAGLVWWLVPGGDELRAAFARAELRPGWLGVCLLATFAATLVTSARWRLMAEAMGGNRLPLVAYFHSLALTKILGQVSSAFVMDIVGRGVALRAAGSQRGLGHAITQAVLERVFDLVLPVMLLAWALVAWRGGFTGAEAAGSFAGVCLLFAALAAVCLAPLTRLALRTYAAARALRARLRRVAVDDAELDPPVVDRRLAVQIGVYSLLRYLAAMLLFWSTAAGIGVDFSFFQIAAATPIGQLAGMLGFTPGALGIQEAGWVGGFKWVGADDAAIALFVLSSRLIMTASFAVLALVSWPLLRRSRAAAGPGQ
ncbi:lysylphosphatidylglycerol synthase transmembrane domain-containing protein [Nannocystis punicea]|uniref:Lysylphosphatidylglycerol synthase transmembrane domain-containing protein n=1 Tax=Nannocystis punicea TaxID=2995304 RepID=A0ABY7HEL1_9BACT|nr:lysylphosphatidylglycerol synthase transmembrane domain-containing protein [Nannocystis poenicansa]WAS97724.1 lysylphosphatidylglycerol synthase transmembrane domain-containing protein [Nannocystis poenicansa]